MAYLIHLAFALAALVVWEATAIAPSPRPWIALALCLVPHVLGLLTHRLFLRGRFRAGERAYTLLAWSPVALHAFAVLYGGWIESVEAWTGRSARLIGWPGPAVLLALAPFAVYTLIAIDARARLVAGAGRSRARSFQARMFAASLAPFAIYFAISWGVGSIAPLRLQIETIALWSAVFSGILLCLFAAGLPWLLPRTWHTEPLPEGAERSLLEAVSARAKFDGRRLLVWHTGQTISNAMILGFFPMNRAVMFTDLLLAQLDLRQLASVYAHEIGHAKRNHVLTFAAWSLAMVLGADWIANRWAPDDAGTASLVLLGSTAVWALGFGWLSRRFELEADVFSLRLLGDPEPLVQALEHVAGPHGRTRTGWRHFSTQRRIEFLHEVVRDPAVGVRLERRVRTFARVGALAFLVVVGLQVAGLVERWPSDRVTLDLKRGNYAAALERAEREPGLEPSLAALARRAGRLTTDDPAELERQARAALESGDLPAAADWLELGALRGDPEMDLVRGVLAASLELPEPDRTQWVETVPERWRDAVGAALAGRIRQPGSTLVK